MSIRTRESILSEEQEKALKRELEPLWLAKNADGGWLHTGMELARILGFGIKGTKYFRVRPEYIYYYRKKLGIARREKARFSKEMTEEKKHSRYKYGKQERLLPPEDFYKKLNLIEPLSFNANRQRVFLILAFYLGLRQSEIRMLRKSDFEYRSDHLYMNAFRRKKGYWDGEEEARYPLYLLFRWPYVEEILDWLERFDSDDLIMDITAVTAWKYVKDILPKRYPHFFRLNRITEMVNTGRRIAEIRAWTGLHLQTIERAYVSTDPLLAKDAAEGMRFPKKEKKDHNKEPSEEM